MAYQALLAIYIMWLWFVQELRSNPKHLEYFSANYLHNIEIPMNGISKIINSTPDPLGNIAKMVETDSIKTVLDAAQFWLFFPKQEAGDKSEYVWLLCLMAYKPSWIILCQTVLDPALFWLFFPKQEGGDKSELVWLLCLMAYNPSWIIWFQTHPYRKNSNVTMQYTAKFA